MGEFERSLLRSAVSVPESKTKRWELVMGEFDKLLSPVKVGTHTWKNRIVKGPSSTLFWGPNQYVNDTVVDTFEAIAKGGASAIILGACVSEDPKMLIDDETNGVFTCETYPFGGLYDDKFIPGMARLADAIHAHGCELIAQIFQNGSALKTIGGSWGPSDIPEEELPSPVPYCFPLRGVSLQEIEEYKERFFAAAERAKKAGLDGIEVHAANGYFVMSFTSRIFNRRTDQYGCQSIENRTRLACELISGCKERLGEDFIVGVRMNGQEFGHELGTTPEEAQEMAKLYKAAGADYISVTCYGFGPVPFQYALDYWMAPEADADMKPYLDRWKNEGLGVYAAGRVKEVVGDDVPVFGIGSLTPRTAEKMLEENKADVALFARGLWADPEIANKLAENRFDDIRLCNHCATCDAEGSGTKKRCRVNPAFGREAELTPKPADKKKKVLVVGGGPAGLEAGRTLAQRGHDVVLCERSGNLAMTLNVATMVKGTEVEQVPNLSNWLISQAKKQPGLEIRMKTEVTPEFVKSMSPDAIVVANGGVYGTPQVEGIDGKNVWTVPQLEKLAEKPLKLFGAEALSKLSKIALPGLGKKCVILGGQIEAIQGAVFLKTRGKDVTVLEDSDDIGLRLPPRYYDRDMHWLKESGVEIISGVTYKRIDKKGVAYMKDGQEHYLTADTVMVFKSPFENKGLYEQLKGMAHEVYAIGSCNGAEESLMVDAIREGREVGCRI